LIAASARILSSLDDVPAKVIPAPRSVPQSRRLPWWTRAAAAVLVVAGGSVLVLQRSAPPSVPVPSAGDATSVPTAQRAVDATASTPAVTPSPSVPSTTVQPKRVNAAPAPVDRARAEDAHSAAAPTHLTVPAATERLAQVPAPQAPVPITEPTREVTPMLRTGAGAPVPREAENRAAKATADARVLGGVAAAASPVLPVCYVVRDAATPRGDSLALRKLRQAGDTVFLAPSNETPTAIAWILRGDGPRPGVRYAGPVPSTAIAIIATPTPCPRP
jgi:hypothetical protein